ncbi:MAG: hypothetical protein JW936_07070 [Sedimentisphaerales bacterium]|nr:hypothetical protein [Sedimentisphaerales bacterium]
MYQKNPLLIMVILVLAGSVFITFTGCDNDEQPQVPASSSSAGSESESAFINTRCPIMPQHAIDPESVTEDRVREYHGQRVAFCCSQCVERWDQITDEEKDELLSSVQEMVDGAAEQMHDMGEDAAEHMRHMTEDATE